MRPRLSAAVRVCHVHNINILCKWGYENRAQFVAHLLGRFAVEDDAPDDDDAVAARHRSASRFGILQQHREVGSRPHHGHLATLSCRTAISDR
jgi:hypothetical protein